jgi:hypothetical protein
MIGHSPNVIVKSYDEKFVSPEIQLRKLNLKLLL